MNPLMAMFRDEPCLMAAEKQARFDACLNNAMTAPRINEMLLESASTADDGFWPAADDWRAQYRPYVVVGGILQVPVKGVLLNNFPYAVGSWLTGYEYITRAIARGLADDNVRGIALLVDSPGGLVAGNQDCADAVRAARDQKPVRGFAHESAYSAAYNIIAATSHVTVSRTGGVGSIGVVTGHMDVSGAMEKAGFKFTYIFAGKHKVDGNPYEALSDDVKARIQARIDELYAVFVASVAANRGMSEQAVRETEALCFTATQATSNGLADDIGSLEDATAAFAAFLDEPSDNNGEEGMSTPDTSAVDQAAVNTARAEGASTGAAEMQARIGAILGSEHATGRETLAKHIAFNTQMSAADADAMLQAAPKEAKAEAAPAAAAEPAASFDGAMAGTPNPQVGANAQQGGGQGQPRNRGAETMSIGARYGIKGFSAPSKE